MSVVDPLQVQAEGADDGPQLRTGRGVEVAGAGVPDSQNVWPATTTAGQLELHAQPAGGMIAGGADGVSNARYSMQSEAGLPRRSLRGKSG